MMMQRVTTELDRGPAVSVCRYPIGGDFDAIRAAGVERESTFVVETLQAIATGRIDLEQLGGACGSDGGGGGGGRRGMNCR